MKRIGNVTVVLLAVLLSVGFSRVCVGFGVDVGIGAVFSGYNDIRAPSDTGTDILSLSDELNTDPTYFVKVRVSHLIRGRHYISVFVAPVRMSSSGEIDRSITFGGEEFPANTPLEAKYELNSYRLTYRYYFINTRRLQAGLGFTADVKNSSISLEGGGVKAEETDTNIMPLVDFSAYMTLTRSLGIIFEANALAIARGRTEDVLLAIQYRLNNFVNLRLSYRMLEGGIDKTDIYNFALLNHFAVGTTISF